MDTHFMHTGGVIMDDQEHPHPHPMETMATRTAGVVQEDVVMDVVGAGAGVGASLSLKSTASSTSDCCNAKSRNSREITGQGSGAREACTALSSL
jgi:hypothetical protein